MHLGHVILMPGFSADELEACCLWLEVCARCTPLKVSFDDTSFGKSDKTLSRSFYVETYTSGYCFWTLTPYDPYVCLLLGCGSIGFVRLIAWYSNSTLLAVTGMGRLAVNYVLDPTSTCSSTTFCQIAQLFFISARSTSYTLFTYIVTLLTAL